MHCRRRTYHSTRALRPALPGGRGDGTRGGSGDPAAGRGGATSPPGSGDRPAASSRTASARTLQLGRVSQQAVEDGQVVRLLVAPGELLLDPAPACGTHGPPTGL